MSVWPCLSVFVCHCLSLSVCLPVCLSVCLWKALELNSWLLLGSPAVNASESNCAHCLDARLDPFWGVRNVMSPLTTAQHAEQPQNRNSQGSLTSSMSPGCSQEQTANPRLFKRSRVSTQQTQNLPHPHKHLCQNLFLSEVAELITTTLRKMPRLSEAGLLGMCAEHWYDFGALVAGDRNMFVQVAHIAAASVPHSVLLYLKDRSRHSPNLRVDTDSFS